MESMIINRSYEVVALKLGYQLTPIKVKLRGGATPTAHYFTRLSDGKRCGRGWFNKKEAFRELFQNIRQA